MTRYSFTLLNLLFIGAIVYFGVNAFYMVTTSRIDPLPTLPEVAAGDDASQASRRPPPAHYEAIAQRNLFGTQDTVPAPPPSRAVDLENLEQTRLQLKLWGTVTGSPEQDYAVIEESGKREQNLYRVGDTVQDATVKMILREKVVLNVSGKDEVLELEKAAGRAAGPRPAAINRSNLPAPPTNRPVRTQRITLRRGQVEEAMQDVTQLMSQVNIRPHFYRGQPDGLMLSRIRPNSLFMRMGLRNGDIITGVNGRTIESVDDAMTFYNSLKSSENVTLDLKRGGRDRKIEYSIR
jgi:general secretion pathway protein C